MTQDTGRSARELEFTGRGEAGECVISGSSSGNPVKVAHCTCGGIARVVAL